MQYVVKIKLDKFLAEKSISRYELSKITGIKYQTIDNYYKNKVVRYDSCILAKLCFYLKCDINDILEYIETP